MQKYSTPERACHLCVPRSGIPGERPVCKTDFWFLVSGLRFRWWNALVVVMMMLIIQMLRYEGKAVQDRSKYD
jgi:hypothetical protein